MERLQQQQIVFVEIMNYWAVKHISIVIIWRLGSILN